MALNLADEFAAAHAAGLADDELEVDAMTFYKFANEVVAAGKQWVLINLRDMCMGTHLAGHLSSYQQLSGVSNEELIELEAVEGCRDGTFWSVWCTCDTVDDRCTRGAGGRGGSHSRWAINFGGPDAAGVITTPVKIGSAGRECKMNVFFRNGVLDTDAWDMFRRVGRPTKGNRGMLHVPVPALFYAASDKMLETSLPENAGSGGSVSHFCDLPGCCGGLDACHLEPAFAHSVNTQRVNCPGATITVASVGGERLIVGERLCIHAAGDVNRCCRKLRVADAGDIDSIRNKMIQHISKKPKL